MDKVTVATSRIRTHCFVSGPDDGVPVLLVHGNLTTGRFWQDVADGFPDGYRLVAPDLRCFGRTERKPVDATHGLREWSDDLHALVEALGWTGRGRVHAAGWSNGGGVLQQYAIDHGEQLASLTLVAPLSPYGFGGSRDAQGTPCWDDWAGTGGGTAAPDFVRPRPADRALGRGPRPAPGPHPRRLLTLAAAQRPTSSATAAPNTALCRSTSASVVAGHIRAMLWNGVSSTPRLWRYRWR